MIMWMMMMMWTLTFCFLFMNHPLSFGLVLLLQTLLISLMTGLMNYTYWFSYILFLVMVGGMLILFVYMTSVASNEKFMFSSKMTLLVLSLLIISLIFIFLDPYLSTNLITMDLINQNLIFNDKYSMTKYMNWPKNMILAMVIMYLLITLIMVVKITNIKYGPLRQKF